MKSKLSVPILVLLGMVFGSCLPVSNDPVDPSGGMTVSIAPYLGNWVLTEVAGEPVGATATILLEVRSNAGVYEAEISGSDGSAIKVFELSEVNGSILASVERQSGGWNIFEVFLQQQDEVLKVRLMDIEVVKEDIESEALDGIIRKWTDTEKVVRITATSSELRTYIAGKSDLFIDFFNLERQE